YYWCHISCHRHLGVSSPDPCLVIGRADHSRLSPTWHGIGALGRCTHSPCCHSRRRVGCIGHGRNITYWAITWGGVVLSFVMLVLACIFILGYFPSSIFEAMFKNRSNETPSE